MSALMISATEIAQRAISRAKISTDHRNYRKYSPQGAAKLIYECTDPEVLVSGPSRTGKSRGWLEKTHYLMETYPRARALWIRKTRASLTNTALQTFED